MSKDENQLKLMNINVFYRGLFSCGVQMHSSKDTCWFLFSSPVWISSISFIDLNTLSSSIKHLSKPIRLVLFKTIAITNCYVAILRIMHPFLRLKTERRFSSQEKKSIFCDEWWKTEIFGNSRKLVLTRRSRVGQAYDVNQKNQDSWR